MELFLNIASLHILTWWLSVFIHIWLPNLIKCLYLELCSNVLSVSFCSLTNSKYLDFMSCLRYELWCESTSQQKPLTTLTLTRKVRCSKFHYHMYICIHCFSFLAFFLWMSYGQERVIWQEVEVLLLPHPEGLWARNPCPPSSPSLRRAWLPACVLVIFIHPDLLAFSWRQQSQSPPCTPDPPG